MGTLSGQTKEENRVCSYEYRLIKMQLERIQNIIYQTIIHSFILLLLIILFSLRFLVLNHVILLFNSLLKLPFISLLEKPNLILLPSNYYRKSGENSNLCKKHSILIQVIPVIFQPNSNRREQFLPWTHLLPVVKKSHV